MLKIKDPEKVAFLVHFLRALSPLTQWARLALHPNYITLSPSRIDFDLLPLHLRIASSALSEYSPPGTGPGSLEVDITLVAKTLNSLRGILTSIEINVLFDENLVVFTASSEGGHLKLTAVSTLDSKTEKPFNSLPFVHFSQQACKEILMFREHQMEMNCNGLSISFQGSQLGNKLRQLHLKFSNSETRLVGNPIIINEFAPMGLQTLYAAKLALKLKKTLQLKAAKLPDEWVFQWCVQDRGIKYSQSRMRYTVKQSILALKLQQIEDDEQPVRRRYNKFTTI